MIGASCQSEEEHETFRTMQVRGRKSYIVSQKFTNRLGATTLAEVRPILTSDAAKKGNYHA